MATHSNSLISSVTNLATVLWWASLLLVGCFATAITGITIRGDERDRLALLAIKSEIHRDPLGITSSWNNSVALCRWKGIACGRKHRRITKLDLSQQQLTGTLSPFVGNLSFLRFISLSDNSFYGVIPPEIGRLSRLETLDLANNSFGGTIPANLSNCSNLFRFIANRNNLVGNIPEELGRLLKLERLHIASNNLTGQLPASIGNVSTLQEIVLKSNYLQGRLPNTLGLLKRLVNLLLNHNNFTGSIPPSFCNISSLEHLGLGNNQFHGSLPVNLGSTFPNLHQLVIAGNKLSGTLPESLSNASKLEIFEISDNNFSGKVYINFQNAKSLSWLNMEKNNLGSGAAGDLDFITTLTNCSWLERFSLHKNQFGGVLPNSIAKLSTTLTFLLLGGNNIEGNIPSGVSNLTNLIALGLEQNQFTGTIPHAIGKLENLQKLTLGSNALTGRIPTSLGNLSKLTDGLGLEDNLLEGSIPKELGKCQKLWQMSLGSNKLTGPLPKEIFNIVTLSVFVDLSDNLLTGSLPSEVGNLKNLVELYVFENKLSGEIPTTLGGCTSLEYLYLWGNQFYGSIPASLSSLRSIEELHLSNNNLSGQIPKYLANLSSLVYLNLSYNHFEGPVPIQGVFNTAKTIALAGNDRLCGGIPELHLPLCHFNDGKEQKRSVPLKLTLIVCGVLGVLSLSSLLLCWLRKSRVITEPLSTFRLGNSVLMVSYQQLLRATDGFDSTNLIGQGSFGRVYRGVLNQNQESKIIAVKVMKLEEQGASKSFIRECRTLRNIRHRNLVKIISACSSADFQGNPFKALIYEFMPNGNLEQWLHPPTEANTIENGEQRNLNFLQRMNIMIDVASALDYLHHHCEVPLIHCDLKPSNILLDSDMVARVGDFGLARFFPKSLTNFSGNSTSTSTLGLKGTLGYAALEYGIGTEATTNGDVYSYGILLLEMFTGKRPTDEMFKDGLTLHHFVEMALPDQLHEVVDPLLLAWDNEAGNIASSSRNPRREQMQESRMKECLVSILSVGIACSVESPKDRMDIVDAAKELHSIRNKFLGARI